MSTATPYSEEIFQAILDRIAQGESLNKICQREDFPHQSNVYRWLAQKPELRDKYARAREIQADKYFNEIIAIADDSTGDYEEGEKGLQFNSEHVQRSRLRIDARKWAASKLAPKKYGDKTHIEHSGDEQKPLSINISIIGDD